MSKVLEICGCRVQRVLPFPAASSGGPEGRQAAAAAERGSPARTGHLLPGLCASARAHDPMRGRPDAMGCRPHTGMIPQLDFCHQQHSRGLLLKLCMSVLRSLAVHDSPSSLLTSKITGRAFRTSPAWDTAQCLLPCMCPVQVCKINSEFVQGITELPGEAEMAAKIAEQHEFNRRNFTQVKRHALMVSSARASCNINRLSNLKAFAILLLHSKSIP